MIQPLSKVPERLSPIDKHTEQILNYLYKERFIVYSLESNLAAFNFEEMTLKSLNVFDVAWELNIKSCSSTEKMGTLESLLHPKRIDNSNLDEGILVWKEIAIQECLGKLNYLLKKFNLPTYQVGERTIKSFQHIFEKSTIAQVYYFLWKAVQNVISYQRSERIPDYIALRTIPGYLVEFCDRFHGNNWSIEKRAREQYYMTAVSKVLYYSYFDIGDKAFDIPLTADSIVKIWKSA